MLTACGDDIGCRPRKPFDSAIERSALRVGRSGVQFQPVEHSALGLTAWLSAKFEAIEHAAHLLGHFISEEHTSELKSLLRISYAVFCLKKKTQNKQTRINH